MLVDAERDSVKVRKSQAITDLKAYDARPGRRSPGLKYGRITHIWRYCEILHRCATYVTVSKQETVYICVFEIGPYLGGLESRLRWHESGKV